MNRTLWMVSAAAGLTYWISNPWHPFPGSIALKGLSVSPLALVAWNSLEGRNRLLLTGALALSSLGDVLLDIRADFFVFGLGAFLFAHLCYTKLFLDQHKKDVPLGALRVVSIVLLMLFSMGFTYWLLPGLGTLAPAVMMYIGVLSAMVLTATAWRTATPHILMGAFLFLISDAVLGASRFRSPVPLRGWIVWGTYYAAQALITWGAIHELAAPAWRERLLAGDRP